jgi:hypothetical protein
MIPRFLRQRARTGPCKVSQPSGSVDVVLGITTHCHSAPYDGDLQHFSRGYDLKITHNAIVLINTVVEFK